MSESDSPAFNSLDTLRQHWDAYRARGWTPIPIAPGQKAPRVAGWQECDGGDHWREQLEHGGNLGLLLGDPSNRLVDVDLDNADALAFARHFLPATALKSGRTGRPSSHWWYTVKSRARQLPKTMRLKAGPGNAKDKATLVELRSNGGQTAVAPSIVYGATPDDVRHYAWENLDAAPAEEKWSTLERAVRELAAACVLRQGWQRGGVHDLVLATAGTLAKAGKPMDDVLAFLGRCCDAIPHEPGPPWDYSAVRQGVESTYSAHAAGTAVRGFTGLAECLGEALAEDFCKLLGIRGAASAPGADEDASLPTITVDDRELRHVTDEALDAVRETNDPPRYFMQGGRLVCIARVVRDGRPRPEVWDVDLDGVSSMLTNAANWRTTVANRTVATFPPLRVAREVLARRRELHEFLPELHGVTRTPVLRPDGTVFAEPGAFDPHTGTLYVPDEGVNLPTVPVRPTDEDVTRAAVFIADALDEFPFADDASRANAWGFLATVVLRSAMRDPVPLFAFTSPTPGTGKTELANLAGYIVDGERPSSITCPKTSEEWEKVVTAQLRTGPRLVIVDNVAATLKSDALDSLATKTRHRGRDLGRSRMLDLPSRAPWAFTGNNLQVGGDLRRRVVLVSLDAGVERPWERTFRKELEPWAIEHRSELLWAFLVLGRRWHAAGRPAPTGAAPMAGYGEWHRLVGGLLEVVGVPGFLGNAEQVVTELDESEGGERELWLQWWARFEGQHVTAADLMDKLLALHEELQQGLQLPANAASPVRALGNRLRQLKGRVHAGLRLEQPSTVRGTRKWALRVVDPEALAAALADVGSGEESGAAGQQGSGAAL